MIATMVDQFQSLSGNERKSAFEMLDSGFFPPRVSEGVKARLASNR